MKIVFFGTPEFAVPSLKMLHENHEVLLVVTQPDHTVGRKKQIVKSPVKIYAECVNLPIFQPEKIKQEDQRIIDLKPDLIITAAYGQMLPNRLLKNVKALNVHGSLLPKYRGGAPIQYALFDGLKETGVTVMYMAEKMDSGDIIKQEKVLIDPSDNYKTLMLKMSFVGANLLKSVLEDMKQGIFHRVSQNEDEVSFAYTIKRDDEWLDFNDTATNILNRIRGLSPEPGASTYINGKIVKFYQAKISDIIKHNEPGTVLSTDKMLLIQTKDQAIEILELQVAGKRKMDAKSFLNGQSIIKKGDHFQKGE
ncbi:MAG: methionyl-tRNA formyltransferase [Acholeplasmataceae bacterium]|nr:methionyl-tRNA formyltransferase [Acholeplasmataceae bacterium]